MIPYWSVVVDFLEDTIIAASCCYADSFVRLGYRKNERLGSKKQ